MEADTVEDKALTVFFQDYGCTSLVSNPWMAMFEMLPNLYKTISSESPTSHAIMAVALANLAGRHRSRQAETLARAEYGKTLRGIHNQLKKVHDETPINEMLAGICLMAHFEMLLPNTGGSASNSRLSHLLGAVAIVQRFGKEPTTQSNIDQRLLNMVYFQMALYCLNQKWRPLLPLKVWTLSLDPSRPGFRLLPLIYRVAECQADVHEAINDSHSTSGQMKRKIIRNLITRMQTLDVSLVDWEEGLPSHFKYRTRHVAPQDPSVSHWEGAPDVVYIYHSSWIAIARTYGFTVRNLLNQNLLECSMWMLKLESESGPWVVQCTTSKETIVRMIHHTCRSVNSVMNGPVGYDKPPSFDKDNKDGQGFRGFMMMWQLYVASATFVRGDVAEKVGLDRFTWLERVSHHVRHLVGSREDWLRGVPSRT